MSNTNINTTITPTIKINAEAFIIPNNSFRIKNLYDEYSKNRHTENAETLCTLNGVAPFDPEKDSIVQFWFSSKDLECENMCDHEFYLRDTKGRIWEGRIPNSHAPKKIFTGHKEGETINYKCSVLLTLAPERIWDRWADIPMMSVDATNASGEELEVILDMQLTLSQTKYRYRNFGNFEDVLARV